MRTAAIQGLWLAFFGLYMAAWWIAVWYAIRRRESFVVPFFAVLLLGLGVPLMLAGFRATAANPLPFTAAMISWIALPFVVVAIVVSFGFLRSRRNRDRT